MMRGVMTYNKAKGTPENDTKLSVKSHIQSLSSTVCTKHDGDKVDQLPIPRGPVGGSDTKSWRDLARSSTTKAKLSTTIRDEMISLVRRKYIKIRNMRWTSGAKMGYKEISSLSFFEDFIQKKKKNSSDFQIKKLLLKMKTFNWSIKNKNIDDEICLIFLLSNLKLSNIPP